MVETKGRQGIYPTPCRAATAMQKPPADRRTPRQQNAKRRTYHVKISNPLAKFQIPYLPFKNHQQTGGNQGIPRYTSDPLQSTKRRTCHKKATGKPAETKGRQGVHPSTKSSAYHIKAFGRLAKFKGRQSIQTIFWKVQCRT